jgi:hypothetical protein
MKTIKNLFLIGLIALAAVITLAGCPTDADDDDDGNLLPVSKGVNALSGKTYFEYQSKTVFSATDEGVSSGTYSVSEVKRNNDYQPVLENGKYTYVETETGAYSWDEDAKTVTLVPEKIAQRENDGGYGALQTRAEYKAALQAMMDEYKKEDEEAFNEELQESDFSSVSAYLDYAVNETFAQKKNAYSFSEDEKALFLEEALPENEGTNDLAGQTYTDKTQDDSTTVSFTSNGTYSVTGGGEEGKYAFDSSDAEYKTVYLQPVKINGKTRAEYYAEQTEPAGYYADEATARAAQTNGVFSVREEDYNSGTKTIG